MKTPDEIVSKIIDDYTMGYPEVARDQGAKDIKDFAYQETAELKDKYEELTRQFDNVVRTSTERFAEIASLRSRLEECRKKQMMG